MEAYVPPKLLYLPTMLHGVISEDHNMNLRWSENLNSYILDLKKCMGLILQILVYFYILNKQQQICKKWI
jgi:hypothetical protein